MAKYRGPVCKLCRREGEKLFLKGARCFSRNARLSGEVIHQGKHGKGAQFRRRRESDYNRQLRAKQKARRTYGVLERQFRRYYDESLHPRGLTRFELAAGSRISSGQCCVRLGFADSRAQARALVYPRAFQCEQPPDRCTFHAGLTGRCDLCERRLSHPHIFQRINCSGRRQRMYRHG